jgi:hypothetical protein
MSNPRIQRTAAPRGAELAASAVVRSSATADLQVYRREVTATQESAIAFLRRAGLVTAHGKPKQLIRG